MRHRTTTSGDVLLLAAGASGKRARSLLERAGHRVVTTNDAATARRILGRKAVRLICATGRSGARLLERCRHLAPDVGRILILRDQFPASSRQRSFGPEPWRISEASLADALASSTPARIAEPRPAQDASSPPPGSLDDPLTGLPNRVLMLDRLQHALRRAARTDEQVALIIFGVDRFKMVNAALGQRVGDELLRAVTERLAAETRTSDSIGRFSGDEFGLVLAPMDTPALAAQVATRIGEVMDAPFQVQGRELFATGSMGIAVSPADGVRAEQLVQAADAALQLAKQKGGAQFQFHSSTDHAAVEERLALEGELRRALARDEFELHYQIQVNAEDAATTGVEGLLRWNHPTRGLVSPAQFIPLLEDTGLIVPVGRWVLEEACRALARWRHGPLGHLRLAINLSPRQFALSDLQDDLDRAIDAAGLGEHSSRLEVEITESMMMNDSARNVDMLNRFRERGITVAMDDFGTGYSSLSYLSALPLDVLKIDRAFISQIGRAKRSDALVAAIIAMAQSLGLEVVSEGVENDSQWHFLRQHGAEKLQGFRFGRPVPESDLADQIGVPDDFGPATALTAI